MALPPLAVTLIGIDQGIGNGRDALGIGRQALLDGLLQLYVDGYDDVLAVHGRLGVARAAGNGRAVGAALLARVARLA